mgnify:CR=1 FL=1
MASGVRIGFNDLDGADARCRIAGAAPRNLAAHRIAAVNELAGRQRQIHDGASCRCCSGLDFISLGNCSALRAGVNRSAFEFAIAAGIPHTRFVPLAGRNHLILENGPGWPRFLQEVQAFLAG